MPVGGATNPAGPSAGSAARRPATTAFGRMEAAVPATRDSVRGGGRDSRPPPAARRFFPQVHPRHLDGSAVLAAPLQGGLRHTDVAPRSLHPWNRPTVRATARRSNCHGPAGAPPLLRPKEKVKRKKSAATFSFLPFPLALLTS